jgi:hypothetical protein
MQVTIIISKKKYRDYTYTWTIGREGLTTEQKSFITLTKEKRDNVHKHVIDAKMILSIL